MGNLGYKDAKILAEEWSKALDVKDFIVRKRAKIVSFLHGDGTYCEFAYACVKRIDEDYWAICTEHHGTLVYHKDDLDWIKEYKRPKTVYFNKDV